MTKQNKLSNNLKLYQHHRNISLNEFANELDIPKSTLRSILADGNTTIVTASHISRSLGISLDKLVHDEQLHNKLFILKQFELSSSWLSTLPAEKQQEIAQLIAKIWMIIGDDY